MPLTRLMYLSETLSYIIAILAITWCLGASEILKGAFLYPLALLIAVITGFILHELAHRNMARKYGCFSRFVLDPIGLLLTIVSGLIPVIKIILPGYVFISIPYYDPVLTRRIEGITAAVGPLVNIVIAILSYTVISLFKAPLIVFLILNTMTVVNAWIAFFNLLPIPPLDGSRVIKWNPVMWGLMFLASIVLLILSGWF